MTLFSNLWANQNDYFKKYTNLIHIDQAHVYFFSKGNFGSCGLEDKNGFFSSILGLMENFANGLGILQNPPNPGIDQCA